MLTHDVDEAVLLSDRIAMMPHGLAATIGQILEVDIPHMRARLDLAQGHMICTAWRSFSVCLWIGQAWRCEEMK